MTAVPRNCGLGPQTSFRVRASRSGAAARVFAPSARTQGTIAPTVDSRSRRSADRGAADRHAGDHLFASDSVVRTRLRAVTADAARMRRCCQAASSTDGCEHAGSRQRDFDLQRCLNRGFAMARLCVLPVRPDRRGTGVQVLRRGAACRTGIDVRAVMERAHRTRSTPPKRGFACRRPALFLLVQVDQGRGGRGGADSRC